jgi:hypothetical protein
MKTAITLLCLAIMLAFNGPADAAAPKKSKKNAYVPPATPTPPGAPSGDLGKFVNANLEKILGPLEQKNEIPRAQLTELRASFAARFSKASLAERPQFQAALSVCDALSQAMDERNKASLNPAAANWTVRSVQLRANIEDLMAKEKAAESQAAAASH